MRNLLLPFLLALLSACAKPQPDLSNVDVESLHQRMQSGELTSEEIVLWHLDRIEAIDNAGPELNAIIEVNPEALLNARALDEEWQTSGPRGPLHGIPVVLKANIDTADRMQTSAGSLALEHHQPERDAFLVTQLRAAGAVILAKSNLSEWANFRSTRSSSGWSSVGGQTRNAYHPDRNPCGSSSGSAVAPAAGLTVLAVGTETDGSIVCPSGVNGIVGIKPTLGLVSRSGIIPIAQSQDTAGPMARSVRDAATLLAVMTGVDPQDEATYAQPAELPDYTAGLGTDGLEGKRIGVIRSFSGSGKNPDVEAVYSASIEAMRGLGAIIVEDIEIDTEGLRKAEYEVLLYEFKTDLERYLGHSGAPFGTLRELIAYNEANAATVMPIFGQEIFLAAEKKGPLTDEAYLEALATSKEIARGGLDTAMDVHELDALVAPTNGPSWLTDHVLGDGVGDGISSSSYAAVSGYPSITVPAGFVSGLPVGLSFIGRPWSEKQLIDIAYAFEMGTSARKPPAY